MVGSNELLASLESLLVTSVSHFVSASSVLQETFPRDSRQSRPRQSRPRHPCSTRERKTFSPTRATPSFAPPSLKIRETIAVTFHDSLPLSRGSRPLIFQEECSGYLSTFPCEKLHRREWPRRNCPPLPRMKLPGRVAR